MMTGPDTSQRGAALLSILLLVAVMAVIAATALDRMTLATRIAGSAATVDQGRAFVMAAEQIALRRIAAQPQMLARALGQSFTLPLPSGQGTARLTVAGNCFNLNALVAETSPGKLSQRPQARAQFAELMKLVGVPESATAALAGATGDWIDSDTIAGPLGAEDAVYRATTPAYLPANRRLVDVSEWRAVRGVSPQIYATMKPWICALPTSDPIKLDINQLNREQAPLIAMLLPGQISLAAARAALAARPADGYGSSAGFWQSSPLRDIDPPADIANQVDVTARWIMLTTAMMMGDGDVTATALIDANGGSGGNGQSFAPPRIVQRAWGDAD